MIKPNSEVSRFLIVGFTTVGIDLAIYRVALWQGLQIDAAKSVGFIAGTIFAYFANRLWTFTADGGVRTFALFCLLYLSTLAINVGCNAGVLSIFGQTETAIAAAFLLATAVSAMLNFLGMKFIVFTQRASV